MSQWVFKMSSCGSNAGTQTPAPLVNGIINNAVFHSSPHINQTLHQILHVLHFCLVESLLNYAPDFVVNWIEVRAGPGPGQGSSKTEFLLIGLQQQLTKIHNWSLNTTDSARNLGFIFDSHLTLSDQISSLSKSCYYDIRELRCIRT